MCANAPWFIRVAFLCLFGMVGFNLIYPQYNPRLQSSLLSGLIAALSVLFITALSYDSAPLLVVERWAKSVIWRLLVPWGILLGAVLSLCVSYFARSHELLEVGYVGLGLFGGGILSLVIEKAKNPNEH
jgi:hypothetical protein